MCGGREEQRSVGFSWMSSIKIFPTLGRMFYGPLEGVWAGVNYGRGGGATAPNTGNKEIKKGGGVTIRAEPPAWEGWGGGGGRKMFQFLTWKGSKRNKILRGRRKKKGKRKS